MSHAVREMPAKCGVAFGPLGVRGDLNNAPWHGRDNDEPDFLKREGGLLKEGPEYVLRLTAGSRRHLRSLVDGGRYHVAGYEGSICGFAAVYAGLAQVLNELYGRTVAPLGPAK